MTVSVVIACLSEQAELLKTIRSLRETATCDLDIVIVDDCSRQPLTVPEGVRLIRNRHNIGVGASRHVGVCAAKFDTVLITDAHMRFCPGWTEPMGAIETFGGIPGKGGRGLMLCGQTLALRETDETWEQHHGLYHGARMVIKDASQPEARYRFLNPVWAPEKHVPIPVDLSLILGASPGDEAWYPLSACMGALYAFSRSFFLKVGGLRMLRGFGGDEELLSLKWLRAGGEIRLCKSLRAAHKFVKNNRPRFPLSMAEILYNKCCIALTCCPTDVAADMIKLLGVGADIRRIHDMVKQNWGAIAAEKAQLDSIFTLTWEDYMRLVERIDSAAPV